MHHKHVFFKCTYNKQRYSDNMIHKKQCKIDII